MAQLDSPDNNAKPYERVWYTPYGEARHHWGQDFDGDRDFDSADVNALLNKISGGSVPITDTANYDAEYDLNRDGTIDFNDLPSGSAQTAVPLGQIGRLDGVNTGPDNWIGYAGYVWEGASALYHVRHRSYSPSLGRWMQRDPAGYIDGMSLYQYVRGRAVGLLDPTGLSPFVNRAEPIIWSGASPVEQDAAAGQSPSADPTTPDEDCDEPCAEASLQSMCAHARRMLGNLLDDLDDRIYDLGVNKDNQPDRVPGDLKNPGLSRDGHRALINRLKAHIENVTRWIEKWCGPNPPTGQWRNEWLETKPKGHLHYWPGGHPVSIPSINPSLPITSPLPPPPMVNVEGLVGGMVIGAGTGALVGGAIGAGSGAIAGGAVCGPPGAVVGAGAGAAAGIGTGVAVGAGVVAGAGAALGGFSDYVAWWLWN